MNTYTLAIKVSECEDKDKSLCLLYQRYGKCRLDKYCKRVNILNPFCFTDKCKQTFPPKIELYNLDGYDYLLYRCNNTCPNFLRIDIEKFLMSLDREDIIYGEKLSKLLENLHIKESEPISINNELEYLKVVLTYMKGENVQ